MTQDQLAAATGLGQSDISKIERGDIQQTTGIARLANVLRVSSMWLEVREGPDPEWDIDELPTREAAHDMSQARTTLPLPTVTWEDLMGADLSQPFELVVIDDALAPEITRGCVARLDPARDPRPGQPVLVRDKAGRHYLRDYQLGSGGRWQAVARSRGFAPLDSVDDGLQLIAAVKGVDWP